MASLSRCPGGHRPPNRSSNSLCLNGIIWQHRSESTLAQVMAWCLTTSSHYPNQCLFIVYGVLRHYLRLISQERLKICILVMSLKITHLTYQPHLPGFNELTHWPLQSLLSLSISDQAKQIWINHWNGLERISIWQYFCQWLHQRFWNEKFQSCWWQTSGAKYFIKMTSLLQRWILNIMKITFSLLLN